MDPQEIRGLLAMLVRLVKRGLQARLEPLAIRGLLEKQGPLAHLEPKGLEQHPVGLYLNLQRSQETYIM